MLVAVLALFLLFSAIGLWASTPVVGGLIDGLPAKEAGFEIGDRIVSVNGREVQTSADASQFITDAGESEIQFVLERDGKEIELSLTPRWSETDRRLMHSVQGRALSLPGRASAAILAGNDRRNVRLDRNVPAQPDFQGRRR